MPLSVGQHGRTKLENGLVGFFIGKKLPFSYVKTVAMHLWKDKGLIEVIGNENGVFFFDFGANFLNGRDEVLDGGPWYFAKQPIILKRWDSRMALDKEQPSTIPIWAKLYNVPWEYWTNEGFSILGSAIGKPLYVDRMTEERARLSYIRMCVEVDASNPLVTEFELEMEGEEEDDIVSTMVQIEYQWVPLRCDKCKVFGHKCDSKTSYPTASMQAPNTTNANQHEKQEWQRITKKGKDIESGQHEARPKEHNDGEATKPNKDPLENIASWPKRNINEDHIATEGLTKVFATHLISDVPLKNVFEGLQEDELMGKECGKEEMEKEFIHDDIVVEEEKESVNSEIREDVASSIRDFSDYVVSPKINTKGGKSSSSKKKKKKKKNYRR